MKLNITVVYPVGFEFEVPDNFLELSYDQQDKIKTDILNKADLLFGNDSLPIIHAATDEEGRNEGLIEEIFGSVSDFARLVEEKGDNFKYLGIAVRYNSDKDIHSFFRIE